MLRIILFLFCISPTIIQAQGGIIARQIFKPGVKVGGEAMYEGLLKGDLTNELGVYTAKAQVNIPIKSKFGVKIQPKELLKLQNLWQLRKFKNWKTYPKLARKLIAPNAHQMFWNFNTQYTLIYGNEFSPIDEEGISLDQFSGLMRVSTGITGIHYLQKMRVAFYSADIGFMEDAQSISRLHPNLTLMGGQAKIQNPFSYYYYGMYLNYNSGRLITIPFAGADLRVANKARLNLTLPLQAKMSFKVNKTKRYALLIQYSGLVSGFTPRDQQMQTAMRQNFTYTYVKTTGILEQKISKNLKLFMEAGWAGSRRLREYEDNTGGLFRSPDKVTKLAGSPYGYIAIYHTFGKSLFDSSVGNLLNF